MNSFEFYSPTMFVFGRDEESRTGEMVKRFGGSKVLVVYGGESAKRSGLLDRVIKSLENHGIEHIQLGGVKPNPRSGKVYEGVDICKDKSIDFILCVGGGSTIDTGKAIAIGALYDGDFWDFFAGKANATKAIPVGTVLTISAAGSEGSSATVITQEDTMEKRGYGASCLRPKFSILNPELTLSLPKYQRASGVVDMMAHVMERYFTNTQRVEITDRLCEGILKAIMEEAPRFIHDDDYQAAANIMWSGMVAHNDICGVGREQDWSSHGLEHELSALYDVAHGAGLAVMFPAWMEYVMDHDVERMAQFATRVFNLDINHKEPKITAQKGIDSIRQFWKSLGMPLNFQEIGAKKEDIPRLVKMLGLEKRKMGSYVSIGEEDARKIYEIAAR